MPIWRKSKSYQIFILQGLENNLFNMERCNNEISHSIDICIQYLSDQFIGISMISVTEILMFTQTKAPWWFYYYYWAVTGL